MKVYRAIGEGSQRTLKAVVSAQRQQLAWFHEARYSVRKEKEGYTELYD